MFFKKEFLIISQMSPELVGSCSTDQKCYSVRKLYDTQFKDILKNTLRKQAAAPPHGQYCALHARSLARFLFG